MTYEDVASKIARKAGKYLKKVQEKALKLTDKKGHDILTVQDKESEELIVHALHKDFPSHSIISEEGTVLKGNELTWIVDPLDGSNHYTKNLPFYCVTMALHDGNNILTAATYIPVTDELFSSSKGEGVRKNTLPIKCSDQEDIKKAVIYLELPARKFKTSWNKGLYQKAFAIQQKLASKVMRIRAYGSGPIGMAYAAMGGFDAYVRLLPLNIDDVIAGTLFLKEAGAIVTDQDGNNLSPFKNSESTFVVAANKKLHKQILKLF
jgi:myo-inositol-1(or 4)-monophosphatase